MFKFFTLLLLVASVVCFPAISEGTVLVELFAAKSCAASARAYDVMTELENTHDDVFVLTWPVNYWDYLEEEPLALEASRIRQQAYVDRFRLRGMYTPQAVVNGTNQGVGSRPDRMETVLENSTSDDTVNIEMERNGHGIQVSGPDGASGDVYIIHYLEGDENPSDMIHPVAEVKRLMHWTGGDLHIDADVCHGACVLLVQKPEFGPILAAMPFKS